MTNTAPKLRNLALRLIGDESIADDLVHEVFVKLPTLIRKFRAHSSLSSFLCGVLINKSKHYVRKSARRRKALESLTNQVPESSDGPEILFVRKCLADDLHRALDQLNHAQRAAFILCEVEEQHEYRSRSNPRRQSHHDSN